MDPEGRAADLPPAPDVAATCPAPITIGRVVIYRSRTGDYDVPAIVNCTVETLSPRGVELGHVPPLSSHRHVHLTVLTPGKPGLRRAAGDFLVESKHGRGENVAGTYQEWDIAPHDPELHGAPNPGTWRWPERVATVATGKADVAALFDERAERARLDAARMREALGDVEPLPERDAGELHSFTKLGLAGWAFNLAGVVTGPLLRDNPGYVFPSEEVSELVRWYIRASQDFDVAELEGYGGFADHVVPPAPINVRTAILLFLEDYDEDMAAQRDGAEPKWETHDDGAEALIEHLRARGFEIVEIGGPDSAFAPAPQTEPGIEQARQTAPEGGAR